MVRPANVAGSFYPEDPDALRSFIEAALAHAPYGPLPRALIVPHAGYVYSGMVAAKGYGLLRGHDVKNIILIGPSHNIGFDGCVTSDVVWQTPIGTTMMYGCPQLPVDEDAFDGEHSLEVQLPFIQTVAPKAHVMPVLVGNEDPADLAEVLAGLKGIIVVSSDLSHFLTYAAANRRDEQTINAILQNDMHADLDACGGVGVSALMRVAAKKGWKAELIDRKNSGDTAGDKKRVVGYASIAFN